MLKFIGKVFSSPSKLKQQAETGPNYNSRENGCAFRLDEAQYLTEHTDIVRNVVYVDLEQPLLISSSDDATVCVWDAVSGRLVHKLAGHKSPIKSMLVLDNRKSNSNDPKPFSDEGDETDELDSVLLITGSSDRTLCVWDVMTGKCLQILKKHKGAVDCISPINTLDRHGIIHNEFSEQDRRPFKPLPRSPQVFNTNKFCTGANDGLLCLWKVTKTEIVEDGEIVLKDDESKKKN